MTAKAALADSLIADDLAKQGANLLAADPDQGRRQLSSRWGVHPASPAELLTSRPTSWCPPHSAAS